MWYTILLLLVLITSTPGEAQSRAARWSLTPDLRIGSVDGPGALTRAADLVVGQDNRLYIVQPQDRLVRVFSTDGDLVRTIGRRGKGPAEFEHPERLGWIGDTLWVSDSKLDRISLFRQDGSLIATLNLVVPTSEYPYLSKGAGVLLANGSALGTPRFAVPPAVTGPASRTPILRLSRTGQVLDTLAWSARAHQSLILRSARGSMVSSFQPFRDNLIWEVSPDGKSIVFVERPAAKRSGNSFFQVTKVDASGKTIFSNRYRYSPRRITKGLADSLLSVAVQQAMEVFGSRSAAEAEVRKALYLPEYHPPVTDVVVGGDGNIWLRREDLGGETVVWNVLDHRGRVKALLTLPKRLRIKEARGNLVWAIEHDELDVPYVVRYRIREAVK